MIRPDFQRATAISFGVHIFIFISALIITSLGPSTKRMTYTVSLLSPETRSMTRTESKTLKKPLRRTPPAKKVPVKKTPVKRTPSAKKKQAMAVKRDISPIVPIAETNKAVEKLQKAKEAREAEAHAEQMLEEMEKKKRLEEIRNQSAALGASGSWSSLSEGEQDRINTAYAEAIEKAILDNWVFAGVGYTSGAVIKVEVLIDGTLIFKDFEKPSSNREYNRSLHKAIIKTKKVAPHPFGVSEDIIITFIPTN